MYTICTGLICVIVAVDFRTSKEMIRSPPFRDGGKNTSSKSQVVEVSLQRIQTIHRAVRITMDRKARNFAVVQVHPSAKLVASDRPRRTDTEL